MLDVKLLPKQWEVFNSDPAVNYDIKLYQGGFGSGKTFLGCLLGLRILSQNHGATWLTVADTFARLKITTCETYEELLDGAKVKYRHHKSDHIIKIPGWGDARIIFKGVDDPHALRSVNGIGGHIEEASLVSEASYLEFLGRLRQNRSEEAIRVILTTNPQSQKGWLFDHFVTNGGISEQEIRGNSIRVSRNRVVASTLENKYVSDAFIATLKASYDEELYNIVVLGQDGDYTRGLVSHNFSDLNVIDTEYKPELELYLTCDFNVDPMSWALAHRYNGEYHFFDEIVIENTNINECVDEFVKRYPKHEGRIVITGDASGNSRDVQNTDVGGTSYTQMINRFNFHNYPSKVRLDVREKNPFVADRIAAWNGMMCNTNGVRKIFINKRCKHLIRNLENLKWKEGGGGIETPTLNDIKKDPKQKFMGHIFDAASYLVEKYDSVSLVSTAPKAPLVVPKALRTSLRRLP